MAEKGTPTPNKKIELLCMASIQDSDNEDNGRYELQGTKPKISVQVNPPPKITSRTKWTIDQFMFRSNTRKMYDLEREKIDEMKKEKNESWIQYKQQGWNFCALKDCFRGLFSQVRLMTDEEKFQHLHLEHDIKDQASRKELTLIRLRIIWDMETEEVYTDTDLSYLYDLVISIKESVIWKSSEEINALEWYVCVIEKCKICKSVKRTDFEAEKEKHLKANHKEYYSSNKKVSIFTLIMIVGGKTISETPSSTETRIPTPRKTPRAPTPRKRFPESPLTGSPFSIKALTPRTHTPRKKLPESPVSQKTSTPRPRTRKNIFPGSPGMDSSSPSVSPILSPKKPFPSFLTPKTAKHSSRVRDIASPKSNSPRTRFMSSAKPERIEGQSPVSLRRHKAEKTFILQCKQTGCTFEITPICKQHPKGADAASRPIGSEERNLDDYIIVDTGEKPFYCKVCLCHKYEKPEHHYKTEHKLDVKQFYTCTKKNCPRNGEPFPDKESIMEHSRLCSGS